MKALSDGNLRMIYGNVSVDIMKRKGCLGVALSDCLTRTPIEVVNHNNAGLGYVASTTEFQQPDRHHKRHPWDTFVPAQNNHMRSNYDSTKAPTSDAGTQQHRPTNGRSGNRPKQQQYWQHGRQA